MYNTSPKLHTKTSPELLTLQVTQHLAGRNPTRLTREQRLFWSCIPWGRSCGNAVTKLLAAKLSYLRWEKKIPVTALNSFLLHNHYLL